MSNRKKKVTMFILGEDNRSTITETKIWERTAIERSDAFLKGLNIAP